MVAFNKSVVLSHFAAAVLLLACSRSPERVREKLPLTAPIPSTFAQTTKLVLGDPQSRLRLKLTGELEKLPFQVEWQPISGGPHTIEAFRAGALDGGSVGDTPPIHAHLTGLDVKIIAVSLRSKPSMKLASAPGSSIRTLADLRGKKLAYSPGQAQGALLLRALRKANIPKREVTLIELGSMEFKDALSSRQVDVAPLGGPTLLRYLKEYGAEGATAIEHGVRDTLAFFYVRSAVLEDPDKAAALREYVKIRTRGQLWAAQHPEAWVETYYVQDQGLPEPQGRELLAALGEAQFPADWSEAISLTQETIDMIAEASGQKSFDASELFDRRFEGIAAEVAKEGASARSN